MEAVSQKRGPCPSRCSKKGLLKQWSSICKDGHNSSCPQGPLQYDFAASPMKKAFKPGLILWLALSSRMRGTDGAGVPKPNSQEAWAQSHHHARNPTFACWIQRVLWWASHNHQLRRQGRFRVSSPPWATNDCCRVSDLKWDQQESCEQIK